MTVIADQWGIPHIYADSMNDAFMVLGYLHARDRLFQMVMQSRLASGGLSEIIGSAAVTSDKFYRTIGLRRSAELTYQWYLKHRSDSIVDNALSIVEAEVEGVNAFIDSMTSAMTPIEFKLLGLRPEP
ncbi:MAG: penicillin acylase family protein [Candidatus Thorarchaeota archaeon]